MKPTKSEFVVYLVLVICVFLAGQVWGQNRPVLDSNAYDLWQSVATPNISNDGKYMFYSINRGAARKNVPYEMVIESTDGIWKLEIPKASATYAYFSNDSKFLFYLNKNDTLDILNLNTKKISYITNVVSFELSKTDSIEWLAYQLAKPVGKLVVCTTELKKQQSFNSIHNYSFLGQNSKLLLEIDSKEERASGHSLVLFNLAKLTKRVIWHSTGNITIGNIVIDKHDDKIAFVTTVQNDKSLEKAIWYYKIGSDSAAILAQNSDLPSNIKEKLQIKSVLRFSNEGSRIFLSFEKKELPRNNENAVRVNVWSYLDNRLQSEQLKEVGPKEFVFVVNLSDRHINQITSSDEEVDLRFSDVNDNLAILHKQIGSKSEANWSALAQNHTYVVSLWDGSVKLGLAADEITPIISPSGQYILFFNNSKRNYYTREIRSGKIINITKGIATAWSHYDDDHVNGLKTSYYPIAWVVDESSVLLHDQYDIWQVDPKGEKKPINLTNGYGKKHNIFFEISNNTIWKPISKNQTLLLIAFNRKNKSNGFFTSSINSEGDPHLLSMGNYFYKVPFMAAYGYVPSNGIDPLKAKDTNVYIVSRQSSVESPNFFSTVDFKKFIPLSNIHPELNYNWLTVELHTYKTIDGKTAQGILYKPQNFDATKKYPIIFHYYEHLSTALNVFLQPQPSSGDINIPLYVSNGYLVFEPDIHYTIGKPLQSAYNYILSAAKYVSQFPYVNVKKMGVQGFSFGGSETNYLVTHTNIFAAACSGAGVSDDISCYGSLRDGEISQQEIFETGQVRMGTTLWQQPNAYINESPIFRANKLNTPLLIMHTTNDGAVPFQQALEFFTGLRRLGKKVWLLEYEDGDHGVTGQSANDFTTRMMQFFDHYLKEKPAPVWLTRGVPARIKGIETGLEYDTSIKTPMSGLLAGKVEGIGKRRKLTQKAKNNINDNIKNAK